ncbi:MAG: ABC transporter ATP-binding protein [Gemmatimonadetes bacterium]|nr:ABC transporter ATP-binding protein [Gemmatimonadota bacterium]
MTARHGAVLSVTGVSRQFDGAPHKLFGRQRSEGVLAVRDVSFSVAQGEVLGLVGESGSGKTTLARMLVRLLRPTAGTVLLHGRDIYAMSDETVRRDVRPRVRMIFQDPDAALNPGYTIGEGIARAVALHAAGAVADVEGVVSSLLERVGMDGSYGRKYPDELSGGEKRRIGICRALSTDPDVIVADEPLSGLDVMLQERVLELLLTERARRGFAIILVSHDLERVNQVCDRVLVMLRGRVVEEVRVRPSDGGVTPYRHPYSVSLQLARTGLVGSLQGGEGAMLPASRDGAVVSGCVLATGCAMRVALGLPDVCAQAPPPLVAIAEGHQVTCHFADSLPAG